MNQGPAYIAIVYGLVISPVTADGQVLTGERNGQRLQHQVQSGHGAGIAALYHMALSYR